MKLSTNQYLYQEAEAWLRQLDFFLTEVAFMKTRLSYVVDIANGNDHLQKAENFQSEFLQLEDLIKKAKAQVSEHAEKVKKKYFDEITHADYRRLIVKMEIDFNVMKRTFNEYVLSFLKTLN